MVGNKPRVNKCASGTGNRSTDTVPEMWQGIKRFASSGGICITLMCYCSHYDWEEYCCALEGAIKIFNYL